MPSRRLEERIRELCTKAITSEDTELPNVMSELRAAMREHVENLRRTALQRFDGNHGHRTLGE